MAISHCAAPYGITIETLTVEYIYMKIIWTVKTIGDLKMKNENSQSYKSKDPDTKLRRQ